MALQEVGSPAIDRPSSGGSGQTAILLANPASVKILIRTIKAYANINITGLKVGGFYLVSGTTYKCRTAATIGAVTAGSEQTFNAPVDFTAFIMEASDLLGGYYTGGRIERTNTGEAGFRYITGDHVIVDDEASYSLGAGYTVSLQGIGSPLEEAAGVSAGVASTAGIIKVSRKVAGVAAGVATTAGAIKVSRKVAGVSAGAATVSATAAIFVFVAGISQGVSAVIGSVKRSRKLAGVTAGVASVAGSVKLYKAVAGISAGVATVSGTIFVVRAAVRNLTAARVLSAIRNLTPLR